MQTENSRRNESIRTKTVLFDMDGTLISLAAVVHAIQKTCGDLGLRMLAKKEIYERIIGWHLAQVFPKIFPKHKKLARKFDDTYHKNYVTLFRPHLLPHVKATLYRLKRKGIKIGYVTTKARITAEYCLKAKKIPCDVLVSADDVRRVKPSPEPVQKAMKALKANCRETIVVGDHIFDILSGKRAGCKTVGITTGVKTRPQLKAAGADYVIDDMKDLLKII